MDERLQSLLPWYVNGSLDEAGCREVEAWLERSEHAREQLAFWQAAAEDQRRSAAAAAEDIGLERVLQRIHAGNRPAEVAAETPQGVFHRIGAWLDGAWLKPAFAAALVVIVMQAVLLTQRPQTPVYRGAAPSSGQAGAAWITADSAFVRVVFDPASTEGQLRIVLAGSGAWLVGGPGDSGEYYLAVPAESADRLLQQLAASGIVVAAQPVERPPNSPVVLDNSRDTD